MMEWAAFIVLTVAYVIDARVIIDSEPQIHTAIACSSEHLRIECMANSVLLLRQARYGRMHLGRCAKKSFGYIGCETTVLDKVDPLCSGRQNCSVPVFNTLHELKPCSELDAFLEVDYQCVPVIPLARQDCARRTVLIQDREGYLPSFHTDQPSINAIHTFQCSVELIAKRGQIWNLTLLDFGQADDETRSPDDLVGNVKNTQCTRYAVVKETVDFKEQTTVICSSMTREKNIYLSTTNVIRIDTASTLANSPFHLISFRAQGCVIPDNHNIVRVGHEGDRQMFRCNTTGETWTMVCEGSRWRDEDQHLPCGADPTTAEKRTRAQDWNSATGLVIVVGLGLLLGVVIGTTLLGLVICYYKRHYRREPVLQVAHGRELYTGPTYGSGEQKEGAPAMYKTYGKSPQRTIMGTSASVEYGHGRRHLPPTDGYKYPYQTCQSGGQFHSPCVPDHIFNSQNRAHAQQEEDIPHNMMTGPSPIPYKTASDTSSSSDHVYEIPS